METTLGSDKRIETFVPTLEEEKTIDKIRQEMMFTQRTEQPETQYTYCPKCEIS